MTFEWPIFLWGLLLVPALTAAYLITQNQRKTYAVRFTNLELLAQVAGPSPGIRRHIPAALFLLGFTALVIAVARPVAIVALPRERSTIMLVMDVSYSMEAVDLEPSRIVAAKRAAAKFVQQLPPAASVGLVSFSGKANLNAPLTTDHAAVVEAIEGLKLDNGTAIGDGLVLALNHIAEQDATLTSAAAPAIIILLSDGESQVGVAPLDAAQQAALLGIEVNTVGIGQRGQRTQIRADQAVGFDEAALQAIATRTQGTYFYAAQSSDLEAVYADLGTRLSWVREQTEVTAIAAGIGALLLMVAALLSLRWFQRFP